MVSDDERREVAERLREIELSKSGYVAWWKIAKALKLKQLDGWFGWEKFDPDSAKRLADLIEPVRDASATHTDATATRDVSQCRRSDVDRDALLELADEMDRDGRVQRERQKAGEQWLIDGLDVIEYARRIREACGMVDAG